LNKKNEEEYMAQDERHREEESALDGHTAVQP
jgi:hypothetical protein